MPGFSENPQPKNSGEKSEKPEKAELDDDTIDDVPESVKEGGGKEEKSDIEKLKNQESHEEVYEVEIGGETYEIPVRVSYFEYPEHIQENTGGVLGYERKWISWDELDEILPESGDFDKNRINEWKQTKEETRRLFEEFKNTGKEEVFDEYQKLTRELNEKQKPIQRQLWEAINEISQGEFPDETFNHVKGAFHGGTDDLKVVHKKEGYAAQKKYLTP
jgi:hypothetical protein